MVNLSEAIHGQFMVHIWDTYIPLRAFVWTDPPHFFLSYDCRNRFFDEALLEEIQNKNS